MKLEEIKTELKGYFLYKNGREYDLAFRDKDNFTLLTNDIEYRTITDKFMITPKYYLLMQIQNQLLDPTAVVNDLSEVIPIIDFKVFDLYDDRNSQIEKHKQILEKIKESKSIFGRKKDFKLICIRKSNFIDNNPSSEYFVIKDNEAVPVNAALIDNIEDAVMLPNLEDLKKALKDNLINQHYENYKEECRKWDLLN